MRSIDKYYVFVVSLVIVFIVSFGTKICFSQTEETDSILNLYKNSEGEERVKYMYQLIISDDIPLSMVKQFTEEVKKYSNSLFYYNMFKAIYYINKDDLDSINYYLNELESNYKDDETLLIPIYFMAIEYFMIMNSDEPRTDSLLTKTYDLLKLYPNFLNLSKYYVELGRKYLFKDNLDSTLYYYLKADSIYSANNDMENRISLFSNLSFIYIQKRNFDKSVYYLNKVMNADENKLNAVNKMAFYNTLLMHLAQYGVDIEKQKDLCFNAIETSSYLEDTLMVIYFKIKLANIYKDEGAYDTAYTILKDALQKSSLFNNKIINAHCLNSLSDVLFLKGNTKQAIDYKTQALELFKNYNAISLINQTILEIAKYFTVIGDYEQARKYFENVKNNIHKTNYMSTKLSYMNLFSNYLFHINDYKNAYQLLEKYSKLNDSINKEKNKARLKQLYSLYQLNKKENENLKLKTILDREYQEKKRIKIQKRFALLSSFILFLLLIFVTILYFLYRKTARQKRELNRNKIQQLKQENLLTKAKTDLVNQKLNYHNKLLKITNTTLIQQTQVSEKLAHTLKELKPYTNKYGIQKIISVLSDIEKHSTELNWKTFEKNFVEIYPDFLSELIKKHPNLTLAEKRLAVFIKMDLSTSEIMKITLQSKHSIYGIKKRLREKLSLEDNDQLVKYLKTF